MTMRRDFRVAVPVQLEFPQYEIQCVDFNFLNKKRLPGQHKIGFVLSKVGSVLTQVRALG